MGQSSGEVIAITAVFTFLELFFVGLRLCARRITRGTGKGMGIDDVLASLAAFLYVVCLAVPIIIQSADANLGNHVQKTSSGQPLSTSYLFNLMERIFETTHVVPISLAKCSLLFFYRRIFRGTLFLYITWATIGLATIWGVSYFFALLFLCNPVSAYVRYGSEAPDLHCANEPSVYYSLAISDVLIDIIILIIPIPFVWRLHMKTAQKVAVSGIFALGSLTIAASMARMVKFIQLLHNLGALGLDPTYYPAPTSYWVIIEASLAIISACLPTIRPVFHGMSPESVIRSVRSVFSLNSLRSNGSKRDGLNDLERSNRKDSRSSTTRLNGVHIPMEDSRLEKKVTRPVSVEDGSPVPEDGMMVHKSFTVTADGV